MDSFLFRKKVLGIFCIDILESIRWRNDYIMTLFIKHLVLWGIEYYLFFWSLLNVQK